MSKIILSPAQALLLLIEHYHANPNSIPDHGKKINLLTKYYLDGIRNPGDHKKVSAWIDDHKSTLFSEYIINEDYHTINNDPTRRYFETQLAYKILQNELSAVNLQALRYYENDLREYLKFYDPDYHNSWIKIVEGNYEESDSKINNLFKEYGGYLKRIREGKLFSDEQGFSNDARERITLLIRTSLWAVSCAQSPFVARRDPMPLNIYGSGFYKDSDKGKILKKFSETTRSQHLGLLKGHMPLSRDDIAMADKPLDYLKPSDQATFEPSAAWVILNFQRKVNPFSNSISGTVLCQLRAMCYLQQKNRFMFSATEHEFKNFFKCFISTLLFYSGGHSLFEFVFPISISDVETNLNQARGNREKLALSQLTVSSLFFSSSPLSVNEALEATFKYNKVYLHKQRLNLQITEIDSDLSNLPKSLLLLKIQQIHLLLEKPLENNLTDSELNKRLINIKHAKKILEDSPITHLYLRESIGKLEKKIRENLLLSSTPTQISFFNPGKRKNGEDDSSLPDKKRRKTSQEDIPVPEGFKTYNNA